MREATQTLIERLVPLATSPLANGLDGAFCSTEFEVGVMIDAAGPEDRGPIRNRGTRTRG